MSACDRTPSHHAPHTQYGPAALVKASVLRPECVGRSVAVGDSNAADLLGRVGSSACRNAICSDGRASEPSKTAPGTTAAQTCSLTPRTPYILLRVKAPVELAERREGIIEAGETGASLSASPTGARVASVGESASRCRVSEERRRHTRPSPRARSSCAKLARRLRHHHHPMFAPGWGRTGCATIRCLKKRRRPRGVQIEAVGHVVGETPNGGGESPCSPGPGGSGHAADA